MSGTFLRVDMTCYLILIDEERECEGGCVEPVGPGLVAMTDEVQGEQLMPICGTCLESLDPRLAAMQKRALRIATIERQLPLTRKGSS